MLGNVQSLWSQKWRMEWGGGAGSLAPRDGGKQQIGARVTTAGGEHAEQGADRCVYRRD